MTFDQINTTNNANKTKKNNKQTNNESKQINKQLFEYQEYVRTYPMSLRVFRPPSPPPAVSPPV
jgi:hypothetical protein